MPFSKFFVGATVPVSLPRNPTDEVLPVHFFDDTPIFRNSCGCWLVRFDEVLDPDMIHGALSRLLTMPGWRKLGGRVRINNGKLEIHVPEKFTPERPAVSYSQVSHADISIDEHPLTSHLPKETDSLFLQASPEEYIDLAVSPKAPHCIDDYLNSDSPQMDLQIVSFKDATLVCLVMPHILGDAMSLSAITNAWSLVLAGRESEVPPNLSWVDDALATAGLDPKFQDQHVMEHRQLNGIWFFMWIMRYLLDMWWWPTMEAHSIFLPAKTVSKLKADTMASLKLPESQPSIADHATPFVSTGDVVYAWLLCMAASVLPQSTRRSVMIGFPCDIRDRAPSIFKPGTNEAGTVPGVYIQNASPPLLAVIPARDLLATPGNIARVSQSIRHTIITQASEPQIHAAARITRKALAAYGLPPIFGDTSQFPLTGTNWTKAEFFDKIDFRPAVVSASKKSDDDEVSNSDGKAQDRVGKPVYFHVNEIMPKSTKNNLSRNIAYLCGTPQGGYWLVGKFPPAVWDKIERELREL